ncbi:MAG: methyltransferase domain-containing protein [Balneolaceae bacterium]
MTLFLKHRATDLEEQMDDPDCHPDKLRRTYRQFSILNRAITRWRSIFDSSIVPMARRDQPLRILDIGCGGGDLIRTLAKWCRREGIDAELMGIDPEPRAIAYAQSRPIPDTARFRQAWAQELISDEPPFDLVFSNHLLHHLTPQELLNLCQTSSRLAKQLVLFNDIRRSDIGMAAFALTAPLLFHRSFIARDGITSIRRSYTPDELARIVPEGWRVENRIPFRLLLIHEP